MRTILAMLSVDTFSGSVLGMGSAPVKVAAMADADSRSGSGYATAEILQWCGKVHAGHDAALERAYRAPEGSELPPIQLGPSEGRLLELLLRLAGARKVVEIGALAGYSALWMARAVGPEGHVWTLESEAEAFDACGSLEPSGGSAPSPKYRT